MCVNNLALVVVKVPSSPNGSIQLLLPATKVDTHVLLLLSSTSMSINQIGTQVSLQPRASACSY